VSCVPQNEMVVLAGDMNGHVGSNSVGYDGTRGGYGFGDRNADGSRILEFADGLNLVICNTLFMKQESKLMTYVAGSDKRYVFQRLPEPNRACLVEVYAVTLDPLLSLYGIIYVTWYTRHLPKATRVRFR